MKKPTIFWDEQFKGTAQGGYFVRNDLFKFFKKLKDDNKKPVGIIVGDDWNLEVIVSAEGEEDE